MVSITNSQCPSVQNAGIHCDRWRSLISLFICLGYFASIGLGHVMKKEFEKWNKSPSTFEQGLFVDAK